MAYMYCNHTGCNETVKVPTKYCPKHMVKPAIKTEEPKGLLDVVEPAFKTKKTTK